MPNLRRLMMRWKVFANGRDQEPQTTTVITPTDESHSEGSRTRMNSFRA